VPVALFAAQPETGDPTQAKLKFSCNTRFNSPGRLEQSLVESWNQRRYCNVNTFVIRTKGDDV